MKPGETLQTTYQLWGQVPQCPGGGGNCLGSAYDPNDLVSEIDLPDGSRYQLLYHSYGDPARITLPTGGAVEYDYDSYQNYGCASNPITEPCILALVRELKERREYTNSFDATPSAITTYSGFGDAGQGEVDHLDGNRYLLSKEVHTVTASATPGNSDGTAYDSWMAGKETQTQYYGADGATLLRTQTTQWAQRDCGGESTCWFGNPQALVAPRHDPRITREQNTQDGLVRQSSYAYDANNNRTDDYEYDWGSGAAGPLLKHGQTAYNTAPAYLSPAVHILNLPSEIFVFSGSGALMADTKLTYDSGALQNASSITGHDFAFGTGYTARGNISTRSAWLNRNGSFLTTSFGYNIAGDIVSIMDPKSNKQRCPTTICRIPTLT